MRKEKEDLYVKKICIFKKINGYSKQLFLNNCGNPIVLSTTFSSRSSVCKDAKFDYVIIDEASQVDVATGALALSSAKNVVIVGDSKQLSNVVTDDIGRRNDVIFDSYGINSGYRFSVCV